MIIDVTGVILIPGNQGEDCPANGMNPVIECCCEECDYLLCCLDSHRAEQCLQCKDGNCPRVERYKE